MEGRLGQGPNPPSGGLAVWIALAGVRALPLVAVLEREDDKGDDSQSGSLAIHTGPSVHPLARWRVAASRPARPLPDGSDPPSPQAWYWFGAERVSHSCPAPWVAPRILNPWREAIRTPL